MPEPQAWRILHTGREDVCLVVDYEATGRPEARFSDLVAQLRQVASFPLPSIWECRQPAAGLGLSGPDRARHWAEAATSDGAAIGTVIGFCLGSAFAVAIADELERRGGDRPATVLIDPELPTPAGLGELYAEAVGGLSSGLSPTELSAAQQQGRAAVAAGPPLRELAGELTGLFRGWSATAFAAAGLEPSYADELAGSFETYLVYLAAAADLGRGAGWDHATVLCSRTGAAGAGPAPRPVTFEIEHVDLLRTPEVAQAVAGPLARRPG